MYRRPLEPLFPRASSLLCRGMHPVAEPAGDPYAGPAQGAAWRPHRPSEPWPCKRGARHHAGMREARLPGCGHGPAHALAFLWPACALPANSLAAETNPCGAVPLGAARQVRPHMSSHKLKHGSHTSCAAAAPAHGRELAPGGQLCATTPHLLIRTLLSAAHPQHSPLLATEAARGARVCKGHARSWCDPRWWSFNIGCPPDSLAQGHPPAHPPRAKTGPKEPAPS